MGSSVAKWIGPLQIRRFQRTKNTLIALFNYKTISDSTRKGPNRSPTQTLKSNLQVLVLYAIFTWTHFNNKNNHDSIHSKKSLKDPMISINILINIRNAVENWEFMWDWDSF
jgi:hypothetical protein